MNRQYAAVMGAILTDPVFYRRRLALIGENIRAENNGITLETRQHRSKRGRIYKRRRRL